MSQRLFSELPEEITSKIYAMATTSTEGQKRLIRSVNPSIRYNARKQIAEKIIKKQNVATHEASKKAIKELIVGPITPFETYLDKNDRSLRDTGGRFIHMAYNGNLKALKKIVAKGLLSALEEKRETILGDALVFACGSGSLPVVQYLIENGADINYKNRDRITPLMYASTDVKNIKIFEYLSSLLNKENTN
jgi:hypothetical protein